MNHAELKNYAPQARHDFIRAVTDRAAFYGVTAAKIEPVTEQGDVAIIAGHAFPASVVAKRKRLLDRIDRDGFHQVMEALAYTWFNRFVAIRFMELHGYLEHGYRVLSHPDPTKTIPEILELAEHVDLPGLSKEKVIDLKLDGNKESELYRMLLLAQCHALHSTMPFLFEGIDDETELVLPENLLHSDSIIRKLVAASDPEDWQEVEVLGWLYQFYISERKDEVMARKTAVPTEDIPAVTQLFTPHWIVRYLVENSLGRLWLLNHPSSKLREHMPYYIEGENETDFLRITKPEDIRILDPACGSGHMLTYAFDLLFLIYGEEGYAPTEIPALILRRNLYGLEICPRAAQLANLALVFKAREKSPRFIQPGNLVQPRILALQNVHFDDGELRDYIAALDLGDLFNQPMLRLLHQFEEATTFGSLIQPCLDESGIAYARRAIEKKDLGSQLFLRETHDKVLRVFEQAEMLYQRYHVVVANPPYMGSNGMNGPLKLFIQDKYPAAKADLMTCFMSRAPTLVLGAGYWGMINLPSWMFLSSFEEFRKSLVTNETILSLLHLGRGVFGSDFGSVAFTAQNKNPIKSRVGVYRRLFDRHVQVRSVDKINKLFLEANENRFLFAQARFSDLPGHVIAYWLSAAALNIFHRGTRLGAKFPAKSGVMTGDDEFFLRQWHEVSIARVGFGYVNEAHIRKEHAFFPMNKEEGFRKWTGRFTTVFRYIDHGREHSEREDINYRLRDKDLYFQSGISWGDVTSGPLSFRYQPKGLIFAARAPTVFCDDKVLIAFLNSSLTAFFGSAINPTLSFNLADLYDLPLLLDEMKNARGSIEPLVDSLIVLSTADWDNFETSWGFCDQPLLRPGLKGATLEASWRNWEAQSTAAIRRMQELETENNRIWIDAYSLQDELTPEVPEQQITLARSDARRDMAAFLSYAVGCMMGRYSLDEPGLILADAADSLAEYMEKVGKPLNRLTFSPDEDGIIPVLDGEWFKDDIVARVHAFLRATFGEATLEANLHFIEESLGKDLRKYFVADFYKDHLQTYKKRPIYWLFSSGKERAFQALVYVHRYHEGTLSRMRTEYVIPLQGKSASRIDQLAGDIQKATSTSHRKKMEKERDTLLKQRNELQTFDEKLRHYADQRIQLDLDDGVKVNYGKFGDLLAEVKAVTGGSDE
jgi:hypothetical protein